MKYMHIREKINKHIIMGLSERMVLLILYLSKKILAVNHTNWDFYFYNFFIFSTKIDLLNCLFFHIKIRPGNYIFIPSSLLWLIIVRLNFFMQMSTLSLIFDSTHKFVPSVSGPIGIFTSSFTVVLETVGFLVC